MVETVILPNFNLILYLAGKSANEVSLHIMTLYMNCCKFLMHYLTRSQSGELVHETLPLHAGHHMVKNPNLACYKQLRALDKLF
jgi:hypothetical protein